MVAQPFGEGNELLGRVRAGMGVVDAADQLVGTVRRVALGAADPGEATPPGDPTLDGLPDALPAALLARLAASGYVAIAAGTAGAERYALGEQVAEVGDDQIRLAVGWDTLPHP